ncbi:MAG: hypothetical protein WC123_07605 [Bacilli bacterium]|jgi:hypothetical protein
MENKKTLKNLFKLSHKISLYVPTKDKNNQDIDSSLIAKMVDMTASTFSAVNGGATSSEALGYWKSVAGELIKEKIVVVFSYSNDLEKSIEAAIEIGEQLKEISNQDAISLEVNNELYFI